MLTTEQIRTIARDAVKKNAMHLVAVLNRHEEYDGANLVALMELFANDLQAATSPDIVGVIDGKMGGGWTRNLAEKLADTTR